MKNLQQRLLIFIIFLTAVSVVCVYRYKIRYGLDIQGGMRVVLRAQVEKLPKNSPKWTSDQLSTVESIIRNRVDALGVAEPIVYSKVQENRIIVELPGLTNRDEALKVIQETAKLEFRYIPELENGTWSTRPGGDEGKGTKFEVIVDGKNGKAISDEELQDRIFSKAPMLGGDKLKPNARADIGTGKPVIHFEFLDEAKGTFEDFTRTHLKKRLAIFLDGKLLSAPVIEDVIPGIGIIQGSFTAESAKTLSDQLNAGALPVPLEKQEIYSLEATLGRQAVQQTLIAGIVGLVLVAIFMVFMYRIPGILADIALLLYALFTFALFVLIPVTLTVPGIAGFILSIGMAVDANILIFERMKEERASGKSLRQSIETGFKRAFSAIADSNICTLITCGVLYSFGTGQVRGFALTLALGVIASMFTAITVSRTFLLVFSGSELGQKDSSYGFGAGLHPKLNVTKRMALWFAISGVIIVPGLVAWLGLGGIKKGIEFTGGTEISVQFEKPISSNAVTQVLKDLGEPESRVVIAADNRAFITMRAITEKKRDEIASAFRSKLGAFATETVTDTNKRSEKREVFNASTVSGAISRELSYNAILAVLIASALIVFYLAVRFSIPNFLEGLKFGLCAVAALLHDVGVLWGAFAILGLLFNWEIDSLFVTAMLTVIGFSVHDTIIIFDRIRENLKHRARGEDFASVADRSIEQTFSRSINTSLTVVITLIALLVLGGTAVRLFATALLIGIVSGTYSSIFNATPLLVWWKRKMGEAALGSAVSLATPGRPGVVKPVSVAPKPIQIVKPEATEDSAEKAARARLAARQRRNRRR